jgi:hypothetical protein
MAKRRRRCAADITFPEKLRLLSWLTEYYKFAIIMVATFSFSGLVSSSTKDVSPSLLIQA